MSVQHKVSHSLLTLQFMIERVIYDQVDSYRDQKKLFIDFSLILEVDFSTDVCLIHLSNLIKFEMDPCRFVVIVLLYLQNAFDTVDHGILIMKLEALGIS